GGSAMGGGTASCTNDGGTTGTVGAWNATSTFSSGRSDLGSIAANNRLFIFGGIDTTFNATADVESAPINADGTLGSFVPGPALPAARCSHGTAQSGGYVYVVGGTHVRPGASASADVDFAPLLADGGVGTWTATSSLPVARQSLAAVASNGFVYAIGGVAAGFNQSTEVDFAAVHLDGS